MKKKASIKSDQPVASKSNVTVPKPIEPARSSGPVDDHKAETATDDGGASPSASDEPLPKDRAAYLLGFYAQIPFVIDYVVQSLNEINGRRQIPQVLTTLLFQS